MYYDSSTLALILELKGKEKDVHIGFMLVCHNAPDVSTTHVFSFFNAVHTC